MNNSSSSQQAMRRVSAMSAALGLLLVGVGATPAHAESVRARQWHLDAMHADDMWKVSTGRGITVAVIDTGVDDSLADLRGQVLDGKDYSSQPGDEHTDHDGHGTNIAAIIAATGARGSLNGSYGLAPGAKILPIRLDDNSGGWDFNDRETIATEYSKAIRYAADTGAHIINISGGQYNSPGKNDVGTPELAAAVAYALDKGKLIFAAAGNAGDSHNQPGYPASTPGVVAVGAINEKIQRSAISQHGPEIDVTAPGEDIVNACPGGTQVCKGTGTSAASALASASAALIWSKHPDWTNNQVLRVLINTMQGNEKSWTHNNHFGYGIVRPRVALKSPGDPGPADEYPLPDLKASASTSPSPQASASAGPGATDKDSDGNTSATAPTTPKGDRKAGLLIGVGISVAVLLTVAMTIPIIRNRRRTTLPPTPPACPPAPGNTTPYNADPYNTPPGAGQRN